MAIPTSVADLDIVASNNSPQGSDSIGTSLDDYLRAHASILKQVSNTATTFTQSGAGAVTRNAQDKMRENRSASDDGAVGDWNGTTGTDDTAAIQSVIDKFNGFIVPPGKNFRVTNLEISEDTCIYFLGGTITAPGATDRAFTVSGGAKLTLVRPDIAGGRTAGLDSNTTNSALVIDNGEVDIEGGEIHHFAAWGVMFGSGGSHDNHSKIHSGVRIHNNGTGIDLCEHEYVDVSSANIYKNGLNAAGTGWSAVYGPGTGYGIYGRFANCQANGNTISSNAGGLYMYSIGGSNPDHNKITGNTINHNYAFGAVFQGLQSYETVIGNTIMSNVTRANSCLCA